jgi:urate oxidase
MPAALVENSYGKSRVRLVKVVRRGSTHDLHELTLDIALSGDFAAAHTEGDNRLVLPTDTMKNTVYALARDHAADPIEPFALLLARHFIGELPLVTRARVRITAGRWERALVRGRPHRHTFVKVEPETSTCLASVDPAAEAIESGVRDLVILKTAGSAFSGFQRDRYTTLAETEDRILGTAVSANWCYETLDAAFGECRQAIRTALIETFAEHSSRSVQHTLYAMGQRALEECPAIVRIHLSLPNRHCLLVDLTPFGLENAREIFVPVDEPHGLIEATLERS